MSLGYAIVLIVLAVVFLGGFVVHAVAHAWSWWVRKDPPFGS